MTLDLKDRKLLYELDRNARIPYTELARRIGVSKEVARYRHRKLEQSGVIQKYFAIIDVSRAGFSNRKAFIKLQDADEKDEGRLFRWLERNPDIAWLVSCDGAYDLAFGMVATDIEKYADRLSDLDNRFGHLFLQRDIAPIVRGQYFYRDYLVGKQAGTERELSFGAVPKKPELDEKDGSILMALGKDGRASVLELAKAAGLSPDAASRRLKGLEQTGVIRNYILVLNNEALGQLHYKVLIRLRALSEKRRQSLVEFCRSHPNVVYIVSRTFGPWEFEIDLEVPDVEAFRKVMRAFKGQFSDVLRDFSYIRIWKIHKYNFCPRMPVLT